MDDLNVTFDPLEASDKPNPKLEYFYFLREQIEARHAVLNHQVYIAYDSILQTSRGSPTSTLSATSIRKNLLALTAMRIVTYYVATDNYLPIVTSTLASRLWNLLTKPADFSDKQDTSQPSERYTPLLTLTDWADDMPFLLWLLFACAIPGSRDGTLSFVGHLTPHSSPQAQLQALSSSSTPASADRAKSHTSGNTRSPPKPATRAQRIVSPSSSRRHRYLPAFILHVAEHLVGERPLTGTDDWDDEVLGILEGFVWNSERLAAEYTRIIARVHEGVLRRAEEDEAEDEDEEE